MNHSIGRIVESDYHVIKNRIFNWIVWMDPTNCDKIRAVQREVRRCILITVLSKILLKNINLAINILGG
jgi:hypothetical protein